jgi:NAD(P)-dependent dehydrogenase (short-subunit alcohol dehydrogenase family)
MRGPVSLFTVASLVLKRNRSPLPFGRQDRERWSFKETSGEVTYAAANGAIIALTRSLASEIGPKGVRVNALLVAWASNAFDPVDAVYLDLPKVVRK